MFDRSSRRSRPAAKALKLGLIRTLILQKLFIITNLFVRHSGSTRKESDAWRNVAPKECAEKEGSGRYQSPNPFNGAFASDKTD